MIRNKKYPQITRLINIIILLLNINTGWALTDTIQLKILRKSQDLIDTNDLRGLEIHNEINTLKEKSIISDSTFVEFLTQNIASYFRDQSQQPNAIEILSTTTEALESKECDKKILLTLYLPLGAAFEEVGLWSTAMDYYHKALTIAQENDMKAHIARIYNNIAVAYYRIDPNAAIEYLNKSLEINKILESNRELYLNYNNLAAAYMRLEAYDKALENALIAMHYINKEKNADMYYFMQCNIGSLYTQKGNYNLAISYLEDAREHFEQSGNIAEQITVNILLAEAHEKAGNIAISNQLINRIDNDMIDKINNAELESNVRTTLAELFKEKKLYKKAYENLEIASVLKDSLQHANDELKVKNLEKIYINEQKIRESAITINELELKKLRSDRQIIIVVIALLILSITLIFFIIRSRMKDKLIKTNAILSEQEKILRDKEMELQHIKEQELKQAIDQKNRELSSYALSYTKDNEFLANLSEELKNLLLEINPRDKEHREHIRNILTQLKQHYSTDNWQEFRYYFEQVHPSFYDRLDEISSGMTQRQKRLCAMLYIGLSTKEISSITFREVRSIESARNRLRKKLNIPEEETIQEFLTRKLG